MLMNRRNFRLMVLTLALAACSAAAGDAPTRRGLVGITAGRPAGEGAEGVQVTQLVIGSPAYKSELRPGDLITHLNDKPITSMNQFARMLYRPRSGSEWQFKVRRKDHEFDLSLVAAPIPQEQGTADVRVEYTWLRAGDGVNLRGLITRPAEGVGPWPTILILPGLGGMPCDDRLFPMYQGLAGAFTRAGYVVVRWDQRGAGDSYGNNYEDVDFDTEVRDAAAVLRTVFDLKIVDRRRIYVFGSGLGGVVAPQVLARQTGVAGLITWATLSRPLVEYMIDVTRNQGRLAATPAPEVNRQVRLTIRLYEHLLAGDDPLELVRRHPELGDFVGLGGHVQGKTAEYWRQLDATPYGRLYGNSTVPVLVLFGEHDFVAMPLDQTIIVKLARAGGRNDVSALLVRGTDHDMNTVLSPEDSFKKLKMREYTFNPVAVDRALEWIKKLEALRFGKSE